MNFYNTAQAIGLPIDGDTGTLSNAGPVLRNHQSTVYGVNIKSNNNWRSRHNANKVVLIRSKAL